MEKLRSVEIWNDDVCEFTGYFHKFIGGHMSAPEAIIEKEDGWVVTVPIGSVRFVNNSTGDSGDGK